MDGLQSFGVSLIQSLQRLTALEGPMTFLSFLGTLEFYLIVVPLIYWLVNPGLGIRILLILTSVDMVTGYLKQLLHQPRPYWLGVVRAIAVDDFYGIPSGHASGSISIWGYLAYRLNQPWSWAVATALVVLIGISRLYLGVHFPHDVVAGWILGLALLYLFVEAERWARPLLKEQTTAVQIALAFGASVVLIGLGLFVNQIISGTPDPDEWARFATRARTLQPYFTNGGALFGGLAGYALLQQRARFQTAATWPQRAARFFLGMVGVLFFWRGLDVVFGVIAPDESTLGYALRYVRYTATAGWATFGAPWAFLRLKLAQPAT